MDPAGRGELSKSTDLTQHVSSRIRTRESEIERPLGRDLLPGLAVSLSVDAPCEEPTRLDERRR